MPILASSMKGAIDAKYRSRLGQLSATDGEVNLLGRSSSLLASAREAAQFLARHSSVEGVCVFGSVARGDSNSVSDIDLLVLTSNPDIGRRHLLGTLPVGLRQAQRLTLLHYAKAELEQIIASGTSFSEHLRSESLVLVDKRGQLASLLRQRPTTKVSVKDELEAELAQLQVYDDLTIFDGNYLFVLARIYGVGKSVVMLSLSSESKPNFNREIAFQQFQKIHPELRRDVDLILSLRPFYKLVTRRGNERLPFSYRNCQSEVLRAIDAVKSIAKAVR